MSAHKLETARNGAGILALADLEIEPVNVPEWGFVVHVRTMSAGELDEWQAATTTCPVKERHARLVAATACDPEGVLLFTLADVPHLMEKRGSVLDRLADVAFRLNGLGDEAEQVIAKKSPAPRIVSGSV